jgi:hypothetical protein
MDNPAAAETGMRQTLAQRSVKIPMSRTIRMSDLEESLDISNYLRAYEPIRTRSRAADVWRTQVLRTMSELIRTRKSLGMSKNLRLTVFRTGMEKLMNRFNMFTENVKAEFREKLYGRFNPLSTYYLDFFVVAEVPGPTARAELVENCNSDFVAIGTIVEVTFGSGQAQTQSQFRQVDFAYSNARETRTNQSEDLPVAVALTLDSLSSEISPTAHVSGGTEDVDLLRREVDELRLENAHLRSRSGPSAGNSEPLPIVSPEVLQLRREMEQMRHIMDQMISQQNDQNTGTTICKHPRSDTSTTTSQPRTLNLYGLTSTDQPRHVNDNISAGSPQLGHLN